MLMWFPDGITDTFFIQVNVGLEIPIDWHWRTIFAPTAYLLALLISWIDGISDANNLV